MLSELAQIAQDNLPLLEYLQNIEQTGCPGLIANTREWILDGWNLPYRGPSDEPTPEQFAAAMFMEANSSAKGIREGWCDDSPEWPRTLRRIAYRILKLAGHPTE